MELLEKIATLVLQSTGVLSSWSTIFTNIISVLLTFSCRNIIRSFYAKLDAMNDFFTNFIFVLIALSLYTSLFKAVSFTLSIGKRFLKNRHSKHIKLQRWKLIKQKLFTLYKNEITTLKFILQQPACSAWLPYDVSAVALLREKGLIKPLGRNIKTIYHNSKSFHEATSYAIFFTIPENVRNILDDMQPELAARWRKVRINNSFA